MVKRGASILLDMSTSWNVTIMSLLTPKANKQEQVDLSLFSLFHLWLVPHVHSLLFASSLVNVINRVDTMSVFRVVYCSSTPSMMV